MTRVKRGYIARRCQTKIHLFASTFIGAHFKVTRTATQQKMRALVSSNRDRGRKNRDFHRLWITRINATVCENEVVYSYSRLINNLCKKQLLLNHKILVLYQIRIVFT